jgi:hypothetical protein
VPNKTTEPLDLILVVEIGVHRQSWEVRAVGLERFWVVIDA